MSTTRGATDAVTGRSQVEGERIAKRLNALLTGAGQQQLETAVADSFVCYLSLILRWNARVNLTAIRDEEGILSRHFVESISCARALPEGIETLLDLGSGAGFPGIPIALCRREIAVTLAESQGKKAAFLREAVRVLGIAVSVHGGRAETLPGKFDCVALRAVDRMAEAVAVASGLVSESGRLALMTTAEEFGSLRVAAGTQFTWEQPIPMPGSTARVLVLGRRAAI